MAAIQTAVAELVELGVRILSPADPRVVDHRGDFLFVASDRLRSVKTVEDRHLECIRASDFLWLVTPDGYVGQSASLELGYALAVGTPIFSSVPPYDITLRQYVQRVSSLREAIKTLRSDGGNRPETHPPGILIDPHDSIPIAQEKLDALRRLLSGVDGSTNEDDPRVEVYRAEISRMLRGR